MKLIIDIDEDVYTRLFDNGIQDNEIATDDICKMARSLRLGTPLPEHHGRLIDADKIMRVDHIVLESAIDNAPTIIEGSNKE